MSLLKKEINYHHDFGKVQVGTINEHKLMIHNDTTVELSCSVDFDQFVHYVSTSFFIEPMKVTNIKPGESGIIEVLYKPVIPFKHSMYYFILNRSDGLYINLSICGYSYGPQVTCKTDTITFNCRKPNEVQRRSFYFTNKGAAEALFNFDINNKGRLKIEPNHGTINPNEKIRFVVSYSPKYSKQYYIKVLKCFILHHAPIRIPVMNIPVKDKSKINIEEMVINPDSISVLPDSANISVQTPDETYIESFIIISERYLNFKYCCIGKQIKKSIAIRNNCGVTISIIWEEDENNIFKINGNKYIPATTSDIIEVIFQPLEKDKVYYNQLSATIMWGQYLTTLNVSITLLGHSFENPSACWPAQYSIEPDLLNTETQSSKITLPTCGQETRSFTTYLVRRSGHLPLSFTLHNPFHTCFAIKPRQGVIRGPFQIFTVEVVNKEVGTSMFNKEKWHMNFNGKEITHCLVLEACTERSKLIINELRAVHFPPTHPRCIQKHPVNIRNPTHNNLRYKISESSTDGLITTNGKETDILSNEIITDYWSFSPDYPGDYSGNIMCTYTDHINCSHDLCINYFGVCEPGQLTTEPKHLSLHDVILGCWENEVFNVINNGHCSMHITLITYPINPCNATEVVMGEVYLEPEKLTIKPGDIVTVNVCATPGGLYHYSIGIGYHLRKCEESEEFITEDFISLLSCDITGDYPIFKIIDIRPKLETFLSKADQWEILEINRLNGLLQEMYLGQEHQETMINLPSSMENSSPMITEIMIKNDSGVSCDWVINQEKICDCELVEKQFGINIFKMVSVCKHKEQITLNPKKGILKQKGNLILTLKAIYELPGEQRQTFCLKVNPEKMPWLSSFLTITFVRYAIPPDKPMIWPSKSHAFDRKQIRFNMVPVFIGQLKPLVQALWFYNSTPETICYEVEPKWVQNSAFSCVNPKESVLPLTSHPLLFKFLPYELNSNAACFTLKTENKTINIKMTCEGENMFQEANAFKMHNKMQLTSLFPDKPIHLSTDHITLPFIPLHSKADAIFYLNNYSDCKLIMTWQRIKLRGILTLNIIPQREYLDPYQRILLKVSCKTLNQPCLLNCNLICEIKKIRSRRTLSDVKREMKRAKEESETILLGISVTVQANEVLLLDFHSMKRNRIGEEILQIKKSLPTLITRESADVITDVFNKILWNIISSKYFQHSIQNGFPPIFYAEFLENEKNKESKAIRCPKDLTDLILTNALSQILSEKFLEQCQT